MEFLFWGSVRTLLQDCGWLIDPFMKSTFKCDSKGFTALSGLMSRTVGGVHGKARHFSDRRLFKA